MGQTVNHLGCHFRFGAELLLDNKFEPSETLHKIIQLYWTASWTRSQLSTIHWIYIL